MRTIIKARWIIAALWIAMAAVLFITAPDMGQLTKEKGQIAVPEGYPSSYANKLLEHQKTGIRTNRLSSYFRTNTSCRIGRRL